MMLAAAMQYSRPSPPMTHCESTSASPGGVKLPSTSTNGFSFEPFFFFLVLTLEALETTSSAHSYEGDVRQGRSDLRYKFTWRGVDGFQSQKVWGEMKNFGA